MCTLADFDWLELSPLSRRYVETELEDWHNEYLPVSGTVLDVGAGCGETALFFLQHGASHVIAIEEDARAFGMLQRNFAGNSRVTTICASITNTKIDIEGAEEGLVMEVHFPFEWECLSQRSRSLQTVRLKRTGPLDWEAA